MQSKQTICGGIIFIIFLFQSFLTLSQENEVQRILNLDPTEQRYRFIEFRAHTGFHSYTGNVDLEPFLESGYGALELRVGWQPSKKDHWAAQYGYPAYGFGVYSGFVGSPQIFGKPNALYGFMRFYIDSSEKRNVFTIEPAVGLTYNLEPYDSEENPLNNAIGAKMAVYFNLKFGWVYKWTHDMDITYGFDATHFSNGRMYTPNYGLNMIGINLGLSYNYNPDQRKVNNDVYSQSPLLPIRFKRPRKTPNTKIEKGANSINLYGAISTVQNYEDQGTSIRYPAYSVVAEYQHKFNNMHSISAGFDYFFDGSLALQYPDDPSKRHHVGIHAGYDFMFWRMTIIGHIGTYLNENKTKPPLFFRPALRYDVTPWLYTQVGLKARGFAADWVEFGIGIRPFKW
ncbi:acyloxyacyl hydrolase [Tenacibaculum tangerinum]|uniref:Acyloxyacyl hydrolase n=1 Tax=Tenacibaculum tangerinum TaxID=3038772 RepID=A0ABY8L3B7_9FLAO|nr:acyloxyacyl hydrolase [Tenacibaculum tangerinum]WGH75122.1 acyloxyacyl hydrolase [Tenacibaculum tangerinum]